MALTTPQLYDTIVSNSHFFIFMISTHTLKKKARKPNRKTKVLLKLYGIQKQYYLSSLFRKTSLILVTFCVVFVLSFMAYQFYNSHSTPILNKVKNTSCWNEIDFEKTEKILAEAPIVKKIPFYEYYKNQELQKGRTEQEIQNEWFYQKRKKKHYEKQLMFIVFLSSRFKNHNLKALWKGKPYKTVDYNAHKTITSYNVSKSIGLKMIPPTVFRKLNGKEGSIELFIENVNEDKEKHIKALSPLQKTKLYTLVFLLGHADSSKSNVLISKNCFYPVILDHDVIGDAISKKYGTLPFVSRLWSVDESLTKSDFRSMPFDKSITLNADLEELKKHFSHLSLNDIKDIKQNFWYYNPKHSELRALTYFKYKGSYYFRIGDWEGWLYNLLLPLSTKLQDHSKEMIEKIRLWDKNNLKELAYGYLKTDETFLQGFLYRKEQFLEAIEEYSKNEPQ